jgi:hypothetical protein
MKTLLLLIPFGLACFLIGWRYCRQSTQRKINKIDHQLKANQAKMKEAIKANTPR